MTRRLAAAAAQPLTDDIRKSQDFLSYVEEQKIAAQRRIDDRKGAIEELTIASARLRADYEAAVQRNNVAIAEHKIAIDDDTLILDAADRALDFGRIPAPRTPAGEEQESSD